MKTLLLILTILLISSCEKYYERERNWKSYTDYIIERSKCGPDSLRVEDVLYGKTGDEIVLYQHQNTWQRWVKKDEATEIYRLFAKGADSLFVEKIIMELPDSVWVRKKCNCNPLKCAGD